MHEFSTFGCAVTAVANTTVILAATASSFVEKSDARLATRDLMAWYLVLENYLLHLLEKLFDYQLVVGFLTFFIKFF